MSVNQFGRRHAPDPNDKKYPMASVLRPTTLRPFRHYQVARHLPHDQGQTGTCVYQAWDGFLASAPLKSTGIEHPFIAYREGILDDEWTENDHESTGPDSGLQFGSSVRSGAKYHQKKGRLKSYVWARSADELALWILTQSTAVMGTRWDANMSDLDAKFVAHPGGGVMGGHAWLVIGYNRLYRMFTGLNSWGPTWGKKGRFYIPHDFMDELIKDDGEACAALEQKVEPVAA